MDPEEMIRAQARVLGYAVHLIPVVYVVEDQIGRPLTTDERQAVLDKAEGYDDWAHTSSIYDADAEYVGQLRDALDLHPNDEED